MKMATGIEVQTDADTLKLARSTVAKLFRNQAPIVPMKSTHTSYTVSLLYITESLTMLTAAASIALEHACHDLSELITVRRMCVG